MKRNFLWSAPALAAALWISGAEIRATAQTVEGVADTATEAASDAASSTTGTADGATDAGSSASTSDANSTSEIAASNSTTTNSTVGDTSTSADASASTSSDAPVSPAGQSDTQSSSQLEATSQPGASASSSQGAGASANVPAAPNQSSTQASGSADLNAEADLSTDATADQTQPADTMESATAADAAADVDADASLQDGTGIRANAQLYRQQNLQQGLQFGQATDRGLAINAIAQDHFFYDSGLRRGDVLVSYAGRPIRSQADFNRWVAYQPGQRVPIVVLRDGRPQTIYVVYRERQGVQHQAGYAPSSGAYLGVTFDSQNAHHAVVRTVAPGSPAEQAGIRAGDVITAVNGNRVGGHQDVIRIVQAMQPGQAVQVAVARQVVLGNRPGVAQASYAPGVSIAGSASTQSVPAVPAVPAPAAGTAESQGYVGASGTVNNNAVVPGSGRYDNTPARAGDADRDGRLLDGDGRVGPAEGRALLPGRRN